jgi:FMN reductase
MTASARIAVVSAGTSDPSSTRLLAGRIGTKLTDILAADSIAATVVVIELAPLATDIAATLVGGLPSERLRSATETLASADVIVLSTPVYKAGLSGLFKSFVDVLDDDLVVGKVVVLAATAGSARHAMVVDDHLRPLVAFLRGIAVPTSIFAAPEDWADSALTRRIERAAVEASVFLGAGAEQQITSRAWHSYQHQFGSLAARGGNQTVGDVDFDTPLMRLAIGGG